MSGRKIQGKSVTQSQINQRYRQRTCRRHINDLVTDAVPFEDPQPPHGPSEENLEAVVGAVSLYSPLSTQAPGACISSEVKLKAKEMGFSPQLIDKACGHLSQRNGTKEPDIQELVDELLRLREK